MTYHEECHEDIHHTCEQLTVTPVPYKPAYVSPTPKPPPYSISPVPYKPRQPTPTPAKHNLVDSKPSAGPYPQQYKSPAAKHFPSLTAHLPPKRHQAHQAHHPHSSTRPTLAPNHLHSHSTVRPVLPHQVHAFTTSQPPHSLHSPTAHSPHPPHLLPRHNHPTNHFHKSTTPFPSMQFSPTTTHSPPLRNFPSSPTPRPSPTSPESSTIQDSFFPSVPRHVTAFPPSFPATTLSSNQFLPSGPRQPKQQRLGNFLPQLDEKRADIVNQFNSLLSRQRRESGASAEAAGSAQFQPFLPRNHLNQHHFLNPLSLPTSFSPTSAVPTHSPQLRLASSGNSLFKVNPQLKFDS